MRFKFLLFALALLLPLLSGCKKDGPASQQSQEGSTYAALLISMPQPSLRTDGKEDLIDEWAGRDDFTQIDLYLADATAGTVQKQQLSLTQQTTNTWRTAAFRTTPGNKKIYVVINNGGEVKQTLDAAATPQALQTAFTQAYGMLETNGAVKSDYASYNATTGKDKIIMAGVPLEVTLQPSVRQNDVAGASAPSDARKNLFAVDIYRAVSRVLFTIDGQIPGYKDQTKWTSNPTGTTSAAPYPYGTASAAPRPYANGARYRLFSASDEPIPGPDSPGSAPGETAHGDWVAIDCPTPNIALENIRWTVMQYEKTTRISPVLGTGGDAFSSPNHTAYIPGAGNLAQRSDKYSYARAQHDSYDAADNPQYRTAATFNRNTHGTPTQQDAAAIEAGDMLFLTETTHKFGSTKTDTGYRKGNTAYVLVRAMVHIYGAYESLFASEQEWELYKSSLVYSPGGGYNYFNPTSYWSDAEDDMVTTTGHLYLNLATNKWWIDPQHNDPYYPQGINPDTDKDGYLCFKNGFCFYYAWLNPNVNNKLQWLSSPVFRNNIYHVNAAQFNCVGFTADPFDPNATPDPDEPYLPDPTEYLPVEETYMNVQVTPIPWTVHSRNVQH